MKNNFEVKLISVTPDSEKQIMYCARVSNPKNQNSNDSKLLQYCIKNKHWSIFEQAFMTVEIKTSSSISMQILRHRSFCFQQASQRYMPVTEFFQYEARSQDDKNRQNSNDDMSPKDKKWFLKAQLKIQNKAQKLYTKALDRGVARESARFLLPNSAKTVMYMSGSLRSWTHYLEVRTDNSSQKEHRDIAFAIRDIFTEEFPIISEALGWNNE